ncbi:mitochondrial carrier [Dendrothele bispora CBS 962.96]|uniref:Mitochondrial carrier n=1 Tax=Dendrothele bispora (strain CBS 962.96) TaxID=1314807 RepID=A0A4S8MV99_DENBC|nr:mitochondrial carrier [Dendrothele bispora CBS 962.96]
MTSTLPPLVQAVAGAIGSASANALTYPIDLATTRLQLQTPQSVAKRGKKPRGPSGIQGGILLLQKIAQEYGISALYDGLLTDTGATLLSNFLYFYFYSWLRDVLLNAKKRRLNSKSLPKLTIIQELFLGFLAGVSSRAISMPLSIITLRLQTERSSQRTEKDDSDSEDEEPDGQKDTGVVDIVRHIYQEQGLAGFWSGFKTTLLLSLNPSITLAFFQVFRRILFLTRRSRLERASGKASVLDPTPGEAFIGGALSNSLAVAILYPLILAKTRLQARKRSLSETLPSNIPVQPPTLTSVLMDAYLGRYPDGQKGKRQGGTKALYQGLEMQTLKGFLSQGVTFLVKGRIEQMVVDAYLRRRTAMS